MEGRPNKNRGISEMFRKGLTPMLKFFAVSMGLGGLFSIPFIFLIGSCASQCENLFYGALLCHNVSEAFLFLLSGCLDPNLLAAKIFFYGFKPIIDIVGFLFKQQQWPFLVLALLSGLISLYYMFRLILSIIAGCFGDRSTIERAWNLSEGRVLYLMKLSLSVAFIMSLIAFIGHLIFAQVLGYQAPEHFKHDMRTSAFYQKEASINPLEDPLKTYSHLTPNQILTGKITPKEIPEDQRFNLEGGVIGMIMNLFICIGYYLLTYCFARVYLQVRSED